MNKDNWLCVLILHAIIATEWMSKYLVQQLVWWPDIISQLLFWLEICSCAINRVWPTTKKGCYSLLKSDPSAVHLPFSRKQLMYDLRSLSLLISVSTSKLSYLGLYLSAPYTATAMQASNMRVLIVIFWKRVMFDKLAGPGNSQSVLTEVPRS